MTNEQYLFLLGVLVASLYFDQATREFRRREAFAGFWALLVAILLSGKSLLGLWRSYFG